MNIILNFIKSKNRHLIITGSFITFFAISLVIIQQELFGIFSIIFISIIVGLCISLLYTYFIPLFIIKFFILINKFDIKNKNQYNFNRQDIIKKLAICHLPIYLLWLSLLNLEMNVIGNINVFLTWVVPLLFVCLFIHQFFELSIEKINNFFQLTKVKKEMSLIYIKILLSGAYLLVFLFLLFFVSTIFFIVGFTITKWSVILAFLITTGLLWLSVNKYIHKSKYLSFGTILLSAFLIIILSIFISGKVYNFGFDSQEYHTEMIIQMYNGWNPFHHILVDGDFDFREWKTLTTIAINSFPKAVEIIAASLYKFTGDYEQSKALQFIFIFATFFITFSVFLNFEKIPKIVSFALSIIIAFNPVSISESLSFYVDGILLNLLTIIIMLSIILFLMENKLLLSLFGISIILCVNIKFTSVIYLFIFLFGIMVLYLFFNREKLKLKFISVISISFLIGFVLLGFHPYISNILKYGSPFFPYFGDSTNISINKFFKKNNTFKKENNISALQNHSTEEKKKTAIQNSKSKIEKDDKNTYTLNDKINKNDALNQSVKKEKQELKKKIIKSISRKKRTEGISLSKIYDRFIKLCFNSFSETGYPLKGHKIGTLDYAKIPFTFKWTELKYIGLPYPYYIGGFGPLFGGILLLSFLIFSLAVIISFRRTLILACILVFILMSVLITSIGFYPRYAPQFWLVPVFVIPVVFYIKNNKVRILAFLLLFELLFNMRLFVNEYYRAQFNATEKFQIKYSRLNKKKSPVKIYFFPPFRSAYKQRFNKMGIKYYEVNDKSEADRYVKRLYWSEGVPRYRW